MYFCKAKMTLTDFILQHAQDDPVRLLLSRDKYPDIDLDLAVTTLEVRKKLRTKVPEWYAVPSLVYPSRLSGEQCSSSETARYKASLAAGAGRAGTPPETCGHPRPHKREGPKHGWRRVWEGSERSGDGLRNNTLCRSNCSTWNKERSRRLTAVEYYRPK